MTLFLKVDIGQRKYGKLSKLPIQIPKERHEIIICLYVPNKLFLLDNTKGKGYICQNFTNLLQKYFSVL